MNTRSGRHAALALVCAAIGSSLAMAEPGSATRVEQFGGYKTLPAQPLSQDQDFGPLATGAQGDQLLGQIEAKWGNVMRLAKGWDASSFEQFREGYRNYPVSVLQQALAAETFEQMMEAFKPFAAFRSQKAMAKTFSMGSIRPEDMNDPQVVEAHQLVTKALGDTAKDLVFVPIAPCTVWDTRYAAGAPFVGAIGNGVTREFFSHWSGGGGDFSYYGGNPACAEANEAFIGGRPFAVMMTVYVNNPTGNGWLTFYRDGDPDPSQATISVYYSSGPTRTQTVITKSSRGYGVGSYDIAVTGRYATADASASVTGYFIRPQATALDCQNPTTYQTTYSVPASSNSGFIYSPACGAGYSSVGGTCYSGDTNNMLITAQGVSSDNVSYFCNMKNASGAAVNMFIWNRCCRTPGR